MNWHKFVKNNTYHELSLWQESQRVRGGGVSPQVRAMK